VDWKIQDYGLFIQKYPNILGTDVAGTIAAVGPGVTNFKQGQRVIGWAFSLGTGEPRDGALQLYSIIKARNASPIPDSMSFERAVVLPLAVSTAAAGLYLKDHLGLAYPGKETKKLAKTILVWGGSSSVGATVIQLARASGLTVYATASTRNNGLVKELGAEKAFDYTQKGVVDEIVQAVKESGGEFVGVYDAISLKDSFTTSGEILHKLGGGHVVGTLPPNVEFPEGVKCTGGTSARMCCWASCADMRPVFATKISGDAVGDAVWGKYLPEALESGQLKAKPDPIVIKGGLDKMQEAFDRQKQGVSAGKIVVVP